LLFAGEASLVTLKPRAQKLPGGVEKFLLSIGPAWPGIVNTGATYSAHELRVSKDGVFDGNSKLADLADVVQQWSPEEVVEISEAHPMSSTRRSAIAGFVVGYLLAAVGIATYSDCEGSCNKGAALVTTAPLVGLMGAGVGAGIAALAGRDRNTYYSARGDSMNGLAGVERHPSRTGMYDAWRRNPNSLARPEALSPSEPTWEQLRCALPPGLRGSGGLPAPAASGPTGSAPR
jgi:hypothetical protein